MIRCRSRLNPILVELCALLSLQAAWAPHPVQASPQVQYAIVISVDGLGGTYLNKLFDGTATGGPYAIPNFTRLKNEGAGTLAAHCDNNTWETLPNHTSIVTARPRDGANGHAWSSNSDPAVGQTIHSNKGSYVAGVFDVAHDNGLRTGMYANKTKFSLFDTYGSYTGGGSYNATYGATDTTGVDNGRDKIDNSYINTALGGVIVDTFITQQKSATPNHYAFLHINEPDAYGHSSDWGSATWNSQVVAVDTMLGKIFKLVEQDVPAMIGTTAIILTADHGNQDDPPTGADRYAVPFYVWGPGVQAGADLYALNAGRRQVAASYPMTSYAGIQPVRNAEANNLALQLLGLGPIPGSTFNYAQDLAAAPASVTLAIAFAGTGGNKVESTSPDHAINCIKDNLSGCSASYPFLTLVNLNAVADERSVFAGWSSNAPAGVVTMDGDKTVTASFDPAPAKVRIEGASTAYYSINEALAAAPAPVAPAAATELRAQALPTVFIENITMDNPAAILLRGGYPDASFSDGSQAGYTTVVGSLTVTPHPTLGPGRLTAELLKLQAAP